MKKYKKLILCAIIVITAILFTCQISNSGIQFNFGNFGYWLEF